MSENIIIIGGGPVGAVMALMAAQAGFHVDLVEAERHVDTTPRAATVHPSTLAMLGELGLMDDILRQGLVARYFDYWDRPTHTRIARFDHEHLRGMTPYPYVVQVEQHKIVKMALERLERIPGAVIHTGTKLLGLQQDDHSVAAHVQGDNGESNLTGDYLVGADGGRSTVRKSLGIEFEGYTWPERFLVLTTRFDFAEVFMGCSYRNYIADPSEWVNLFKVAGDDGLGRWRAVFPTRPTETDAEALSDEGVRQRLQGLAGTDEPARQLLHRKLYKVHQRVAKSFRAGRVFLAGDAAHVNNPIGGLGLNCGIHDACELVSTLLAAKGSANEVDLNRYESRRRPLNIEFVQRQTIANKQRLEEQDPKRRESRLQELSDIASDSGRARAFLMRTSLLDSLQPGDVVGR